MKPRQSTGLSSAMMCQILARVAAGHPLQLGLSVLFSFFHLDARIATMNDYPEEVDHLSGCGQMGLAAVDCQLQVTSRYPVVTFSEFSDAAREHTGSGYHPR